MAIGRQRRRREEQRRAKARRLSSFSETLMSPSGSSLRGSVVSLDGTTRTRHASRRGKRSVLDAKMMGTVTTFHVGIVFLMMGLMCVVSSLVPGYITRDWQEFLGIGCFLVVVGSVLIIVNRVVSAREERRFTRYISRKLAPTKMHQPVAKVSADPLQQSRCAERTEREPLHYGGEQRRPSGCRILQEVHDADQGDDRSAAGGSDVEPVLLSPSRLEIIDEEVEGDRHNRGKHFRYANEVAPVHELQQLHHHAHHAPHAPHAHHHQRRHSHSNNGRIRLDGRQFETREEEEETEEKE